MGRYDVRWCGGGREERRGWYGVPSEGGEDGVVHGVEQAGQVRHG